MYRFEDQHLFSPLYDFFLLSWSDEHFSVEDIWIWTADRPVKQTYFSGWSHVSVIRVKEVWKINHYRRHISDMFAKKNKPSNVINNIEPKHGTTEGECGNSSILTVGIITTTVTKLSCLLVKLLFYICIKICSLLLIYIWTSLEI